MLSRRFLSVASPAFRIESWRSTAHRVLRAREGDPVDGADVQLGDCVQCSTGWGVNHVEAIWAFETSIHVNIRLIIYDLSKRNPHNFIALLGSRPTDHSPFPLQTAP